MRTLVVTNPDIIELQIASLHYLAHYVPPDSTDPAERFHYEEMEINVNDESQQLELQELEMLDCIEVQM